MLPISGLSNQECMSCGLSCEYPFVSEEFVQLFKPRDEGDYARCTPSLKTRFFTCRRCGYVVGLEDTEDPLQQAAIEFGERLQEGPVPLSELPVSKKTNRGRPKKNELEDGIELED